jgi:hypothetical protein
MWFRAFVSGLVLVSLAVGCAKQAVGQRCGLAFGNDDCTPGLICRPEGASEVNGFCCPNGAAGDIKNCAETRASLDGGVDSGSVEARDAADLEASSRPADAQVSDTSTSMPSSDAGDASANDASDAMR